jgi:hypothetical protein
MIPPITGPKMAPTLNVPTKMANAVARCFGSRNNAEIRPYVEGIRVAPATPSTARATISISALLE